MATAYIIRYGKEKVGFGPGVDAPVSVFCPLEDVGVLSEAAEVGGGGGSMTEGAGDCLDSGSGRDGIGSSDDEVSIVMFFVDGGDWRSA